MRRASGAANPRLGPVRLRRRLSLGLLVAYGVGTTVGAGIYVLAGRIVAIAGIHAPVSFLLAAMLAGLSAFSFAELSARMPRSAGEAFYVRRGLRSRALALVVGLMVAASGVISSATISRGFAGHLGAFVPWPPEALVAAVVVVLTVIAVAGILEAVLVAAILTAIEVGGLVLVVWVSRDVFAGTGPWLVEMAGSLDMSAATQAAIVSGAVLAFFAFIGFEDMVNVAEEVREPARTMPRAIVLTLVITGVLYVIVSLALLLGDAGGDVIGSETPLAALFAASTGASPIPIVLIGTLAIVNGALIQIVMGARVVYGLASQRQLPGVLAYVHPRLRTPAVATPLIGLLVLTAALVLPLETLARTTSVIVLMVFVLVNLALIAMRRREPRQEKSGFRVPIWVPVAGAAASAALAAFQLLEFFGIAG